MHQRKTIRDAIVELHQREIIRDAVVELLMNRTSAGARVESTRVDPHKKHELPALSVYTLREPVDSASAGTRPRELTRDLQVEIVGWVAHSAALKVDRAMDALAKQIEDLMDADPQLGGVAADSILEDTEMEILKEGGDPVIGVVTLTYSVKYYTSPAPPANLDDFRRAGVTTRVADGGPDSAPIEDLVTVQVTAQEPTP